MLKRSKSWFYESLYKHIGYFHRIYEIYAEKCNKSGFKHMNSPYGWGGMNGEQDCSSFIRQIFACFGITLPRNSTGQIQNGTFAASFEKNEPEHLRAQRIIKTGVPGISLYIFRDI